MIIHPVSEIIIANISEHIATNLNAFIAYPPHTVLFFQLYYNIKKQKTQSFCIRIAVLFGGGGAMERFEAPPTRRNSRLVLCRSRYSFSPPISPSLHLALRALGFDALAGPRQGSNLDFDEKRGQTIRSILFFG